MPTYLKYADFDAKVIIPTTGTIGTVDTLPLSNVTITLANLLSLSGGLDQSIPAAASWPHMKITLTIASPSGLPPLSNSDNWIFPSGS